MTSSETFSGNLFEKKLLWIVIVSVFLIYLLYPTKNFYWDGIYFSQVIEDAPELNTTLLHPNHLFYNVVGYLAYQATRTFGWQIRAIYVLEFISSFFGAVSAIMFFLILKRLLKSDYLSLTLTALFAFSATWWKFSTDADAYVPSVFFLLIAFYLILPEQPPRPLFVALAHSAAMFLHELAVIFFLVAVLGIVFQTAMLERRRQILFVMQYVLTAFLLTFGTFCLSFYALTGSFNWKNFISWLTFYTPDIGFTFDAWKNLFLTFRGNIRLFVDGRFNFLELDALNIILLFILVTAFIVLVIKTARNLSDIKLVWQAAAQTAFYRHPITILCAVWIAAYLIFLFFFIPGNTFYRLFYLPALILSFGLLLASSETLRIHGRQWRTTLLVVVVAVSNFLFFIRPYSQVRKDTPLSLALEINQLWSDKTIVYYKTFNSDNMLVRYFNPTTKWKSLESTDIEELNRQVQNSRANGETIWIETTAVDFLESFGETAQWIADNSDAQQRKELINKSYRLKFIQIVPLGSGN